MKSEPFDSVLASVNGEPSDGSAVELACELLKPKRGRLFILYVIEVERGLPLDAEIAPATAKGEDVLREMEEIASRYKCLAQAELLQSRQAGSAVVQEAVDKEVDAVVLGVPYKERYGSFTMGDVASYVLENAPCRVVVWRDGVPGTVSTNGSSP